MRDTMKSKIIFLDLDGTLVHPHMPISQKNKEAILQAQQNGHLVYICTGRNVCGIDQELKELGFNGIIASAGGYIQVEHEVLEKTFIDDEKIHEIMDIFTKHDIAFTLESTDCTYADEKLVKLFTFGKEAKTMNSEMQRMCNEVTESFHIRPLEEYYQNVKGIHKVSFIAKEKEALKEPQRVLKKDFQFVIHDIFSKETINGEIIINHTNKATAIDKVLQYLRLDIKDAIAFGDSMNDYEMLEAVGYAVAMENASEELKQIANSICKDVKEDAIYHEFKKLQLI